MWRLTKGINNMTALLRKTANQFSTDYLDGALVVTAEVFIKGKTAELGIKK